MGASYHEKASTSEVLQVFVEGVDQLELYFGKYLPQFFFAMLAPITLFRGARFCQPESLARASRLRAVDSAFDSRGAEDSKTAAEQILGEYMSISATRSLRIFRDSRPSRYIRPMRERTSR